MDDITFFVLNTIVSVLTAWWSYTIGETKGFHPVWSGVAGFFFGLIAVLVLYVRKPKKLFL